MSNNKFFYNQNTFIKRTYVFGMSNTDMLILDLIYVNKTHLLYYCSH